MTFLPLMQSKEIFVFVFFSLATCSGRLVIWFVCVNGIWLRMIAKFFFSAKRKSSYPEVLLKIAGVLKACDLTKNEIDD